MRQDLRAKMALYVNRTIDTIGGGQDPLCAD